MAVKTPIKATVKAQVVTGNSPITGEPETHNRNFNNLRTDATTEDTFDVIVALMSLQKHTLGRIEQVDYSNLTQE